MKIRILFLFLLSVISKNASAQHFMEYDTLHRNEVSVSFLPVVTLFAGYDLNSRYGSFNFSYKRYFKNGLVFRTAAVISPEWHMISPYYMPQYDTTIGGANFFISDHQRANKKFQLNVGFEKIIKINRLMHAFGFEVYVNQRTYDYSQDYRWYPAGISPTSQIAFNNFTTFKDSPTHIYNVVDSLSYSYSRPTIGYGLQLLYTLRYRINKRFYVSSSMGPYLTVVTYKTVHNHGNRDLYDGGSGVYLDAMVLIHDLSLAFRF